MTSPYDDPTPKSEGAPRVTILTVLAILFAIFGLWEVTTSLTDAQDRLVGAALETDDEFRYHYVARLPDGSLWATTRLDVAQAANASGAYRLLPETSYQARVATLGGEWPGVTWGDLANTAMQGARVGKTVTFEVPPANGTGEWNAGPTISRTITQGFDRIVFWQEPEAAAEEGNQGRPGFNLTQLDAAIGPLEEGGQFVPQRTFPPAWPIIFEDVNWDNSSITFRHDVSDGDVLTTPVLPGPVTVELDENDSRIGFRLDLQEGDVFAVEPQSDLEFYGLQAGSYRVATINETAIGLEYHTSLRPDAVGKPVEIKLVAVERLEPEGEDDEQAS